MEHVTLRLAPKESVYGGAARPGLQRLDHAAPRDVTISPNDAYAGHGAEVAFIDARLTAPSMEAVGVDSHADVFYFDMAVEGADIAKVLDQYEEIDLVHILSPTPKGRRFMSARQVGAFNRRPDSEAAAIVAAAQQRLLAHGHVLIERRLVGDDADEDNTGGPDVWLDVPAAS